MAILGADTRYRLFDDARKFWVEGKVQEKKSVLRAIENSLFSHKLLGITNLPLQFISISHRERKSLAAHPFHFLSQDTDHLRFSHAWGSYYQIDEKGADRAVLELVVADTANFVPERRLQNLI